MNKILIAALGLLAACCETIGAEADTNEAVGWRLEAKMGKEIYGTSEMIELEVTLVRVGEATQLVASVNPWYNSNIFVFRKIESQSLNPERWELLPPVREVPRGREDIHGGLVQQGKSRRDLLRLRERYDLGRGVYRVVILRPVRDKAEKRVLRASSDEFRVDEGVSANGGADPKD